MLFLSVLLFSHFAESAVRKFTLYVIICFMSSITFSAVLFSDNVSLIYYIENLQCEPLANITNGNKIFLLGSEKWPSSICRIQFSCNPGYQLVGNKNMYCFMGKWSANVLPQCIGLNNIFILIE